MKPVPVAPTGTRTSNCFWDGHDKQGKAIGGFGPVELKTYPPHPRGEELARIRKAGYVNLGLAAGLLGIRVVEMSGLEHGRFTFETDAEWDKAESMLRSYVSETLGGRDG